MKKVFATVAMLGFVAVAMAGGIDGTSKKEGAKECKKGEKACCKKDGKSCEKKAETPKK